MGGFLPKLPSRSGGNPLGGPLGAPKLGKLS